MLYFAIPLSVFGGFMKRMTANIRCPLQRGRHIFSCTRGAHLARNHYENYSPQMVLSNPSLLTLGLFLSWLSDILSFPSLSFLFSFLPCFPFLTKTEVLFSFNQSVQSSLLTLLEMGNLEHDKVTLKDVQLKAKNHKTKESRKLSPQQHS